MENQKFFFCAWFGAYMHTALSTWLSTLDLYRINIARKKVGGGGEQLVFVWFNTHFRPYTQREWETFSDATC